MAAADAAAEAAAATAAAALTEAAVATKAEAITKGVGATEGAGATEGVVAIAAAWRLTCTYCSLPTTYVFFYKFISYVASYVGPTQTGFLMTF